MTIAKGYYQNGYRIGKWTFVDKDGDERYSDYQLERVGALCRDGSTSSATGRGACSWHGGVAEWLMDSVEHPMGGTGKYQPT